MIGRAAILLSALLVVSVSVARAGPVLEQVGEFSIPEANQGVGVDANHFYAVDNQVIAKYDKKTGKLVKKWQGDKAGPILHFDSAMVMDGKLYLAHSNYPDWPMTSSLEIFDAETLQPVATHSFVAIDGMDRAESDAVMEQLYEIGERPEFIYEHEWQLGDFLMWDNRCSIHARRDFPKEERRLLRRCTVEGDLLHEIRKV